MIFLFSLPFKKLIKKKIAPCMLASVLAVSSFAQTPGITWSESFHTGKETADIKAVYADKNATYISESHFAKGGFFSSSGSSKRISATLIKLDKDLKIQYNIDFDKMLKEKEFEKFFFIKNKIFLLAHGDGARKNTITFYAAEINKDNGGLSGSWKELTTLSNENKSDDFVFRANYNIDSSKMVLVSILADTNKIKNQITLFDENLNPVQNLISITNEFEQGLFNLNRLIYTNEGTVALLGREYEYLENKKKKEKNRRFKGYVIRIYSSSGALINEVKPALNNKRLSSAELVQARPGELIFASFYSDRTPDTNLNGLLVLRINSQNGNIISSGEKEINSTTINSKTSITAVGEAKENNSSNAHQQSNVDKEYKYKDDMIFQNFIYTNDSSLIVIAEGYGTYEENRGLINMSQGNNYRVVPKTHQEYDKYCMIFV